MDLNFDEKTMLALYYVLYGDAYNLNDNERIDLGRLSLIRHRKMQDAIYFLQQFNCGGKKRDFTIDWYIPYSSALDLDLTNLEKKEAAVQQFNLVNKIALSGLSINKNDSPKYDIYLYLFLNDYFEISEIKKMEKIIILFRELHLDYKGMDTLCKMIYVINNNLPGVNNFNEINELIEKDEYYKGNMKLKHKLWKFLYLVGLRKIDKKNINEQYVPSGDSEVIAGYLEQFEYEPAKTEEALKYYDNLDKSLLKARVLKVKKDNK